MPFLGSIIPNSLVGIGRLESAVKREQKRKAEETDKAAGRGADGADLSAQAVDEAEAVRAAKGNDTEEGHEDRAQHAAYGPYGQPNPARRKLDIEG